MALHYANKLLPPSEKSLLQPEFESSLKYIDVCINALENHSNANNLAVLIHRLITSVNLHLKLKYIVDNHRRLRLINLLLSIYFSLNPSFDVKVKILEFSRTLVNRKYPPFNFEFNSWRVLWEEALGYITRDGNSGALCSTSLMSKLLENIVSFVHAARCYIPAADMDKIVEEAHAKLSNRNNMQCVEGLLLLINCLRTDYTNYDAVVPRWIGFWTSVAHNSTWDSLWLTLFCRARKHTHNINWAQWSSLFSIKARELMSLPAIRGQTPQNNAYPMAIPHMYSVFVHSSVDSKKIGLNKLAKLMYSLTLYSAPPVLMDATSLTPPKLYSVNANDHPKIPGFNSAAFIRPGAIELISFVQTMRTFLYPSNAGAWTPLLAYFLTTLISEISRHFGRNLTNSVFDLESTKHLTSVPKLFTAPVHISTVRFLNGYLASAMMESLYGKNPMMTQFASACLKNLCGMDPTLGRVIVPFLLGALDPQAVNQSHQAPVAIHALSDCLSPLLFPCPVLLEYLPELLRLSLPGIDTNDAKKTCVTLEMYASLLSWMRVKKAYVAPHCSVYPPSNYSIISSEDQVDSSYAELYASILDERTVQMHYDRLAIAFEEWAPALLDKIFEIVESQAEPKRQQEPSQVVGFVANCTGLLLQACSFDTKSGYELRTRLENKIIEYYRASTPLNAAKISGKIVSTMTECNPSCLPRLLAAVLSPDVLNGVCSTEKLAFRLQLIAGSVRLARDHALPLLGQIQQFFKSKYLFHSEKTVREAALKLLKDLLRGISASYPLPIVGDGGEPCDAEWSGVSNKEWLLGAPTMLSQELQYHQPSIIGLSAAANVIRDTAVASLEELRAIAASFINGKGTSGDVAESKEVSSVKKTEERIQQLLQIIKSCMRGAAEVFGDGGEGTVLANASLAVPDENGSVFVSDEAVSPLNSVADTILAGRIGFLTGLNEKDSNLYSCLRADVLRLLSELGSFLSGSRDIAGPLAQLKNSSGLISCWLDLYEVTLKQRMSFIKDVGTAKKWFSTMLRMQRTMLTRAVRKLIKLRMHDALLSVNQNSTLSPEWRRVLGNPHFWLGKECSLTTLGHRAWIHYITRMQQLSVLRNKKCLRREHGLCLVLESVFFQLTRFSQHGYDAIRSQALQTFFKSHSHFGQHALNVVHKLLLGITPSAGFCGTNEDIYARASGIFSMLGNDVFGRKFARQWTFLESFLKAILTSHLIVSAVTDQDKRETLSTCISGAFTRYTLEWCNVPVAQGGSADSLVATSLANVGYQLNGTTSRAEAGSEFESRGLRYESYSGFIVLHLIGHDSISILPGMWLWALRTLATAHGQPSQMLALSALGRLCGATFGIRFDSPKAKSSIQHLLDVQSCLSPSSESNIWNGLLTGLSTTRYKGGDDAPQWSRGVDSVLTAGYAVSNIVPRREYCVMYDRNVWSNQFSKEHAQVLYTLFVHSLAPLTDAALTTIFEASQLLPSGTEEESRSSNATRAELFAAILRATIISSTISESEAASIVKRLMAILQNALDSLSYEYFKDWAEALMVGLVKPSSQSARPFIDAALKEFTALLTSNRESSEGEEGFAIEGKKLILVQTCLIADITAANASKSPYLMAPLVSDIIERAGTSIIRSYRSSRLIVARIYGLLVDCSSPHDIESMFKAILASAAQAKLQEDSDEKGSESKTAGTAIDDVEKTSRNALELACNIVQVTLQTCINIEYVRHIQSIFLKALLIGAGNAHTETAKTCHDACLLICQAYTTSFRDPNATNPDSIARLVDALSAQVKHSSWHVRETVILCLGALMVNAWSLLTGDERKSCKDLFSDAFSDLKPEIQNLARLGLVGYLSNKTPSELKSFAEAYCRNSDKYVLLEKKRKLESKNGDVQNEKLDPKFFSTVMMMSCIILSFPYDLPSFMPALVTALVRHAALPALKDPISRTILEFKRTHQDRWEEFKIFFTRDQLDSLVSASRISYFS